MPKRTSYQVKKNILLVLKERAATYADLERKVNTGFRTVKSNCEELKEFGHVRIDEINKHPSNGRKAHKVSLTKRGMQFLENKHP